MDLHVTIIYGSAICTFSVKDWRKVNPSTRIRPSCKHQGDAETRLKHLRHLCFFTFTTCPEEMTCCLWFSLFPSHQEAIEDAHSAAPDYFEHWHGLVKTLNPNLTLRTHGNSNKFLIKKEIRRHKIFVKLAKKIWQKSHHSLGEMVGCFIHQYTAVGGCKRRGTIKIRRFFIVTKPTRRNTCWPNSGKDVHNEKKTWMAGLIDRMCS